MPGAPLSLLEREEIGLALIEDRLTPWAVIARRLSRHPKNSTTRRTKVSGVGPGGDQELGEGGIVEEAGQG